MKNFRYFFKNLNTVSITLLVVAIVISLSLTGKINGFHLLGLLFTGIALILARVSFFNYYSKVKDISFLKLFIVALVVRLAMVYLVSVILTYVNGFPFVSDKDDYNYNDVATAIANNWQAFGIKFNTELKWATGFYSGFPNFSALAMLIFGKGWWAPRIGNAIISSITVVYCARGLYLLYPVKLARVAITLLVFSPVFITYSSLQLKDTLLIFLISGVIYHFLLILNKRSSVKGVATIVVYLSCMLFIRAATIPPILIAMLTCLFFSGYKLSTGYKILGITIVCLVVGGVVFFWTYLSDFDLLQSPETYFQSRYDNSVGANARVGQNALISASHLAYLFSAPLFIVGSIILPIPLPVQLQGTFFFTNYEYTANIFSMALTPFFAVALYNWFKNRQKHKEFIFIIAFYFVYKVGQAFSLSILSLRQSLPTVLCMYMILPFFFLYKPKKFLFRLIMALDILAILIFAIVRLSTRSAI